jgi:hypothetical protein
VWLSAPTTCRCRPGGAAAGQVPPSLQDGSVGLGGQPVQLRGRLLSKRRFATEKPWFAEDSSPAFRPAQEAAKPSGVLLVRFL